MIIKIKFTAYAKLTPNYKTNLEVKMFIKSSRQHRKKGNGYKLSEWVKGERIISTSKKRECVASGEKSCAEIMFSFVRGVETSTTKTRSQSSIFVSAHQSVVWFLPGSTLTTFRSVFCCVRLQVPVSHCFCCCY